MRFLNVFDDVRTRKKIKEKKTKKKRKEKKTINVIETRFRMKLEIVFDFKKEEKKNEIHNILSTI